MSTDLREAPNQAAGDIEANKRVALGFIDRVFVHGDPNAIDELTTGTFTAYTFGPQPVGRDFLRQALPRVAAGISDAEFRIEDVIAEGDKVAVRLTTSATHTGEFLGMPASGNRYSIQEIHIFGIRDGKVAEHWHEFDRAALLAQLQPRS